MDITSNIIGIIGGICSLVFGTPAIVLFFLNRKNANKKLEIEEGGLSVTQFTAQTAAYQDLLNRANRALSEANTKLEESVSELAQYKGERETLMAQVQTQGEEIEKLKRADSDKGDELALTNDKLEKLRKLFTSYVDRVGIPLTTEEQEIFEMTEPSFKYRRFRPGEAK